MMTIKITLGLLLAVSAPSVVGTSPALAQSTTADTGRTPKEEYQRGYAATPMPDQAAINAGGAPGTAALNGQADAASQESATAATGANQAQYDADRTAYMDALAKHDAAFDRTDARYHHQQNAYADAMAAWREQVYACEHGHQRACDLPAPNPADYY